MKRGSTDYCLVVGIDKPAGMSSHDMVNRVRRVFGYRALDPLLDEYLTLKASFQQEQEQTNA